MVSGAVMIGRYRENEYFVRKCIKIACLIVFWSITQTICCLYYRNEPFVLSTIVSHVYEQSLYYCNYMWFLCALFGLYLLTPLINAFIGTPVIRKNLIYLLILAVIFSSLSAFTWKINPFKNGPITHSILLYYISGFVLYKSKLNSNKSAAVAMGGGINRLYTFFIPFSTKSNRSIRP